MSHLICITGNTGVGKTTLARALAAKGQFATGFEQHTERPFQTLLKQDARYALANQVDYLLLRAEQERLLRHSPFPGLLDGGLEMDFFCYTRLFQARGYLSYAEFCLCERLYRHFRASSPAPELIIHLNADLETIHKRLAGRNRINIATSNDLPLITTFLDDWLASQHPSRIIQLDVSSVSESYEEVIPFLLDQIRSRLKKTANYENEFIG